MVSATRNCPHYPYTRTCSPVTPAQGLGLEQRPGHPGKGDSSNAEEARKSHRGHRCREGAGNDGRAVGEADDLRQVNTQAQLSHSQNASCLPCGKKEYVAGLHTPYGYGWQATCIGGKRPSPCRSIGCQPPLLVQTVKTHWNVAGIIACVLVPGDTRVDRVRTRNGHALERVVEVAVSNVVGVGPVDHAAGPFNGTLRRAVDAGGPD